MIHIYPAGFHLALDSVGAGLALAAMVLVLVAVFLVMRRVNAAVTVAFFATASILGILMVHRGTMAPAQSWPVILAAYQESTGEEHANRAAELQRYWAYGEIREDDWLNLSKRWGVCHAMWPEEHCRRPPGPYEPQGIAREMLEGIARGQS